MKFKFYFLFFLLCLTSVASLVFGSVDIELNKIFAAIVGNNSDIVIQKIIFDCRIPQCVVSIVAGASLATSGLILQTILANPLAGPSILGISTGASLGVAVATTIVGNLLWSTTIVGAIIGAVAVLILIMTLSTAIRSNTMLLIVGIMISSIGASAITLLNYWSPAESVKSFAVWGMGTFANVSLAQLPLFAIATSIATFSSLFFSKQLNAMLLGDNYAASIGINIQKTKYLLLLITGLQTSLTTAFCGPIAFLGLAVPHIVRLWFKSSNHIYILPATLLCGSFVALICNIICVSFPTLGQLPLNAVTPIFGAPIVIYVATKGRTLH